MNLTDIRVEYGKLYGSAETGTVERSAYYQMYIILMKNKDRKNAAVKIRALREAVPEDQKSICSVLLQELVGKA
jgi:hypothetical protein